MIFQALVSDKTQFDAVINLPFSDIFVESYAFSPEELLTLQKRTKEAGKDFYLALPHIFRTRGKDYFREHKSAFEMLSPDGFLIRNLEELSLFTEIPSWNTGKKIADSSLYHWNKKARDFLLSLGFTELTLPTELNPYELKDILSDKSTLILYGHLPLMITANCLRKTIGACDKKNGNGILKDRTNREMPVITACKFCENYILNSTPLCLAENLRDLESIIPRARFSFTTESKEMVNKVFHLFERNLKSPEKPDFIYTKGAFSKTTL